MLIGLCGKAGSGKSVVGDHLTKVHGFVPYAFGDKLKYLCMDLFDLTYYQCFTPEGKNEYVESCDRTVREILQFVGTEVGRSVCPTVWTDHLFRSLDSVEHGDSVITDVRFHDEAEGIRMRNGWLIRVVRTDHPGLTGSTGDHVSEALTNMPSNYFDYEISAPTGALWALREQANTVVNDIDRKINA